MAEPLVGVVGGYGAVGAALARQLHDRGGARLRIGGRDPHAAAALVDKQLEGRGEAAAVDVYDPGSLAAFCAGCAVVVNCAGPSYRVLDRVAVAALAAGAHYVDPGGDLPVRDLLTAAGTGDRAAVLNAGLMPGLTALLPLGLARAGSGRVARLTAYAGLVDRMTPAGAAEYLLSLGGGHGEPLAAWRGGRRVSRALEPLTGVEVPFYPGRVAVHPFLSGETEWLAATLGADEVDWYNVFDGGGNVVAALSRLRPAMLGAGDLESAARELAEAAALDLFGRDPYQLFVFEIADAAGRRVLVLRTEDTYEATALLAAQATADALAGRLPAGVHLAAEVVAYPPVADALRAHPTVRVFEVIDGGLDGAAADEGEL
nr:saccharopine dehydrogenase NADP-binding domain-containing protein [Dactylosporangium thailandense]